MKDFERKAIRLRRNQNRIFDFPGGSVEIARTSDGDYWAHLAIDDADRAAPPFVGTIIDGRIDRTDGTRPETIPTPTAIRHIALRVSTKQDGDK